MKYFLVNVSEVHSDSFWIRAETESEALEVASEDWDFDLREVVSVQYDVVEVTDVAPEHATYFYHDEDGEPQTS